eukprot:IDg21459t1
MRNETRISNTQAMYVKMRDFVRQKRVDYERVIARQVQKFLVESGLVAIKKTNGIYDRKDMKATERAAQRDSSARIPPWEEDGQAFDRLRAHRLARRVHQYYQGQSVPCLVNSSYARST